MARALPTVCVTATLVVCHLLLGTGIASAQSRGFAVSAFEPSSPGSEWYATDTLDLRGALRSQAGLLVDWAYAPLVLAGPADTRTKVLVDQVLVHARASLVLAERFRAGVSFPLAIYEHGDDPAGSIAARAPRHAQAAGDLRLDADVRLFGTREDAVRGAAGIQVFLPSGQRAAFTSDGTVRVAPRFLLAGDIDWFAWAARLAFTLRPFDGRWEGRELGSQVSVALSAGVNVNDRFTLGPEVYSAAVVTGGDAFASHAIPVEVLLGGHVRLANDFLVGTAIGGRVSAGDGAAKQRVLAVLEYAPDVCVDKDGDGICAYEDACPEVDGIRTGLRKTNGCPADRDGDGVPDRNDQCPDEPGNPGGVSKDPLRVGCPPAPPEPVSE